MKYHNQILPAFISISVVLIQAQISIAALSSEQIEAEAKKITVQIVDPENPRNSGSGVIIKKNANTYTVITAQHVVINGRKNIITSDRKVYSVKDVKPIKSLDLAIVEFNSNENYQPVKIGNSNSLTATSTIYVSGFPSKTAAVSNPELFIIKGQINANNSEQRDGYNIIYDNSTTEGMSGGALLNDNGQLVGIHGRGDRRELNNKSLGIGINRALQQMQVSGLNLGLQVTQVPKQNPVNQSRANREDQSPFKDINDRMIARGQINKLFFGCMNDIQYAGDSKRKKVVENCDGYLQTNPSEDDKALVYTKRGIARYELEDKQGGITDLQKAAELYKQQRNKKMYEAVVNLLNYYQK